MPEGHHDLSHHGGNEEKKQKFAKETPMTNLYLALLDRMGVAAERVGDSTGKLENI